MTLSGQNDYIDKMMADARVRHETVKKLLKIKDYNMLCNPYREQLEWDHYVFEAVANLAQMKIENEETSVFQVCLDDDNGNN